MDTRVRRDVYLAVPEIAELVSISFKTVRNWIHKKKLKANTDKRGYYQVNLVDLIHFLHKNPKYCDYISEPNQTDEKLLYCKKMITQGLKSSVKLYTVNDLMDKFHVRCRTVHQWIEKKWLIPLDYKPAHGGYVFTEKEIEAFLDRRPKYKIFWFN